jgi:transposase
VLSLPSSVRIFLSVAAVDLRKAYDGLTKIVRDDFGDDPFSGALFLFLNKRRNRLKVLAWDENGFWIFQKRLERGTFGVLDVARESRAARVAIDRSDLAVLLDGIERGARRFRKHFVRRVRIEDRARGNESRHAPSRS